MEEFAEVMSKCGMIMRDTQTQKYKLKLYAESDGQLKGDGLCDYIKVSDFTCPSHRVFFRSSDSACSIWLVFKFF